MKSIMVYYKKRENLIGRFILALILILATGLAYRAMAHRTSEILAEPVRLPTPLEEFPMRLGAWQGVEAPIPQVTVDYMKRNYADDFVSRRYTNETTGQSLDFYVVFCSTRPAGILGHRPRVCYPAHGFTNAKTEKIALTSLSGRDIDCMLHRFHRSAPFFDETYVISFYLYNGFPTTEEENFSNPLNRIVNLSGDHTRYIAQAQFSSSSRATLRRAVPDFLDQVVEFFPETNSKE